ncbi:MAG: DUF2004 domain-containing protein [Ferruginibacter sp.]
MAKYTLPCFGQLDTENLEEYYDTVIRYNNSEVSIDLNFCDTRVDPGRLEIAKKFIEQIGDFDLKNKQYIEQDYRDEDADTVREYVAHHLEELGDDELDALIDPSNKKLNKEEQLVKRLSLVRMGLYPDSDDQFAIFDYSIGPDITQYLVVLFTDEFGNLDYITMES